MNISNAKDNIFYCFKNVTGWQVELEYLDLSHHKIPQFYGDMYEFLLAQHGNTHFFVIVVKGNESVTSIAKRKEYFENLFKKEVVFYFAELSYRTKQRLIRKKISFIHGNKYIFALFLGVIETRTFGEVWDSAMSFSHVSLSGQRILLAYLNNRIESGDNGKNISIELVLSPMTISNGLKELELSEYCDLVQNGTAKEVRFPERRELWDTVKDRFESPVKGRVYVSNPPKSLPLSGLSALSHKTLLADDGVAVYAIDQKEFSLEKNQLDYLPQGEGSQLEVWKWDPKLFSKEGVVDPFSLALSLKGEGDERILIAIESMIKEALS